MKLLLKKYFSLWAMAAIFQSNNPNDKQPGKRRRTQCVFSRPFRKNGVVPLAICLQISKKGHTVDTKGIHSVQKKSCHLGVTMVENEESETVTQHATGVIVNYQIKGKILAMKPGVGGACL